MYKWVANAKAGDKIQFNAGLTRRMNLNKLTSELVANNSGLNLSSKNSGDTIRAVDHTIEVVTKPLTALTIPRDCSSGSKTEPWKNSEAKEYATKQLLTEDSWMNLEINFGEKHGIPWTHIAEDIWKEESLFQKFTKDRFRDNLKRLHESIGKSSELSEWDLDALNRETLRYPVETMLPQGYPRWNTSPAKNLLEMDVKQGKHVGIPPRDFRLTREEYKQYPSRIFRDRLYAVIRKQKSDIYLIHKRNKSMMKKHIDAEDGRNEHI